MASGTYTYKQDMPPEGGYRPLSFERTKPRKFFSLPLLFGLHAIGTTLFYYGYKYDRKTIHMKNIEDRSGFIALQPMLEAENDRAYFRQLRRNRDEEAELMKDVPNWEVGTLYGKPVFKTIPAEEYIKPGLSEYYAHTRLKYQLDYVWFRHTR